MTILVRAQHAADLGLCGRGQSVILQRYGIDPIRFSDPGIPADELRKYGNALINRVVDHAEKQANGKA